MSMTDRYFFELSTLDDAQTHDFDNDTIRQLLLSNFVPQENTECLQWVTFVYEKITAKD